MTRFCTRRTLCLAIVLAAGLMATALLSPAIGAKKPPTPPPTPAYTMTLLPLLDDEDCLGGRAIDMNNWGDVLGLAVFPSGDYSIPFYDIPVVWWAAQVFATDLTGPIAAALEANGWWEAGQQPAYGRHEVGNVLTSFNVDAAAINDDGTICGWATFRQSSRPSETDPWEQDFNFQAVFRLSRSGTVELLDNIDLALPGSLSYVGSINNNGDVVGCVAYGTTEDADAYLWKGDGTLSILPIPEPFAAQGMQLNDARQVAGSASAANGGLAFRFDADTGDFLDLGTLGTTKGGVAVSYAKAINNAGQVAGFSNAPKTYYFHAFRYTDGAGMQDLGTFGKPWDSSAKSINDLGQVVGTATNRSGLYASYKEFLYTDQNGMLDLWALITNAAAEGVTEADFNKSVVCIKVCKDRTELKFGRICGNAANGALPYVLTPDK